MVGMDMRLGYVMPFLRTGRKAGLISRLGTAISPNVTNQMYRMQTRKEVATHGKAYQY